jgi:uncharacterized membrane protein YeiH
LAGALLLIALNSYGVDQNVAILLSMTCIIIIRLEAIRWHIHLPRLRADR